MIRSELAIFDLATGRAETILATDRLVEAPNWLPDGSGLLVNADGGLFRVPFANPTLQPLGTGRHRALNNDHGPSPDGRWIAFCDKTDLPDSCIYLMPAAGGPTRRLTAATPSWFHGWMPDGQSLLYTAVRGGAFGIFTIPIDGTERCIVTGPGHHDGPDATPDGQWVWFNADRTGSMALWRVRPDGSACQAMTHDDRVNWFPHPSPCGRHVLYLSYDSGTLGHPRDLPVELRLMPAAGGAARTLLSLFGGQGSLNVPCWSPDARRFAFVRYRPVVA